MRAGIASLQRLTHFLKHRLLAVRILQRKQYGERYSFRWKLRLCPYETGYFQPPLRRRTIFVESRFILFCGPPFQTVINQRFLRNG